MVSRLLLARREGFEPPAFWSVGCLKAKSESFRLRFVLFTTVRSVSFPLFPSSPARSNSILGQNWVKGEQKSRSVEIIVFIQLTWIRGLSDRVAFLARHTGIQQLYPLFPMLPFAIFH